MTSNRALGLKLLHITKSCTLRFILSYNANKPKPKPKTKHESFSPVIYLISFIFHSLDLLTSYLRPCRPALSLFSILTGLNAPKIPS